MHKFLGREGRLSLVWRQAAFQKDGGSLDWPGGPFDNYLSSGAPLASDAPGEKLRYLTDAKKGGGGIRSIANHFLSVASSFSVNCFCAVPRQCH